ncbi:class I SAM-dependent methyltransferase [Pseudonocardia sp. GCM10023141]|uniref:class I SAM-dependent methyltransferase n=1 Tax=Pseudonocardia sp. GCM10023141 TaxID=3252653 RepID=UPI0036165683
MSEGPAGWGTPLYDAVLDAAGVGAGTTVLDLGCGPGEFARRAAGLGAAVTGIDVDPGAVAVAAAAVPEGAFAVGDAHDPPHGPFDVVVAMQLLPHVRNPVVVLQAAGAAGATVAITVWGAEQECDVRAFGEALAPLLPPRRAPEGPPPLTDPDRLRQVVGLAGLEVVGVTEVICPFDYPDEDELIGPLFGTAIGRTAARAAGPAAVRAAVLDRLAGRRTPGGAYRLENLFRVLIARPPAGQPAP